MQLRFAGCDFAQDDTVRLEERGLVTRTGRRPAEYVFSGSGCRAATTPPRAAAEPPARTAPFAGSLCAAGRGATRRSATSSITQIREIISPDSRTT